jgi:hypothetical protein
MKTKNHVEPNELANLQEIFEFAMKNSYEGMEKFRFIGTVAKEVH